MSISLSFDANIKEAVGKTAARAARKEGRVPAIVYGNGKKEVGITLDKIELVKAYNKGGFTAKLTEIKVGKDKLKVIPRAVQLHPVTDEPLHVDFMFVEDNTPVKVLIKVNFENAEKSPGLKRGGVLNIVRRKIELLCEAANIPDSVTADLSGYAIGASVHVSSIDLPEGVKTTIERDFTIAAVTGRGVKTEDEDEESEEAEGSEEEAS